MDGSKVEEGTGNVFADLALPDAQELMLKADLVARLRDLIAERGMTQTKAAAQTGMAQGDLSKLLRGSLRGCSVERLLRMLTTFDQDVEITLRPKAGDGGRIRLVRPAA